MGPKKVAAFTPYFTEEETGQVRAAFLAAGYPEGYASVSDLIVAATMREVKRLQRRHNRGRKWAPAPGGVLRRGQRTREEIRLRHDGP
ncbi:ParB family protein [Pseudarthrobacter albicanus]|uniref:ParB family protein n=1 Tax=Pseudarthrobacter albicanus TaxID=2823873 RepID=UPI001BAAB446|nr:hypothetical protein [Pseudarthrobacter albicanus]